jgi:hypothetical protein
MSTQVSAIDYLTENIQYTSCFCEENVYKLAEKCGAVGYDASVVFISSESKQTPIWCQRSARGPDEPVLWDYHVVLLVRGVVTSNGPKDMIFDLDCTLACPTSVEEYFEMSFRPSVALRQRHMQ